MPRDGNLRLKLKLSGDRKASWPNPNISYLTCDFPKRYIHILIRLFGKALYKPVKSVLYGDIFGYSKKLEPRDGV